MARKPRIHVPGGVYHVMLRGNGGQDIFFSAEDRYHCYLLLQEGTVRYGYRIHGFCFMTNHVHLAVQVGDIGLSRPLQNLSFRYARWINRRHRRLGHLFQGRYKAILVDGDSYLLELVRYIHLNPVRAGLVDIPEGYQWSGHNAYLGKEPLPWLTTDWVLGQFSRQREVAQREYVGFLYRGFREGHREEFHRGAADPRVLGDDRFMEKALSQIDVGVPLEVPLDAIVSATCQAYGLEEIDLQVPTQQRKNSEARAVIAYLAQEFKSESLNIIGTRFNRDSSSMSTAVSRLRYRAKRDDGLMTRIKEIRSRLSL